MTKIAQREMTRRARCILELQPELLPKIRKAAFCMSAEVTDLLDTLMAGTDADAISVAVVDSMSIKALSDVEVTELLAETLKFLHLCSQGGMYSPSRLLDAAWHELLQETEIYQAYCKQYLGGEFVHHRAGKPQEGDGTITDVASMQAQLQAKFETVNERWWVTCDARCCNGCRRCRTRCCNGRNSEILSI